MTASQLHCFEVSGEHVAGEWHIMSDKADIRQAKEAGTWLASDLTLAVRP